MTPGWPWGERVIRPSERTGGARGLRGRWRRTWHRRRVTGAGEDRLHRIDQVPKVLLEGRRVGVEPVGRDQEVRHVSRRLEFLDPHGENGDPFADGLGDLAL